MLLFQAGPKYLKPTNDYSFVHLELFVAKFGLFLFQQPNAYISVGLYFCPQLLEDGTAIGCLKLP